MPVAYVSGLAMRRAADLYAGAAKTDPKDAEVLADYAWRNADRLTWTTITDEFLARLRILNGRDTDLVGNATRARTERRPFGRVSGSGTCRRRQAVSVSGLRAGGEMAHPFGAARRWLRRSKRPQNSPTRSGLRGPSRWLPKRHGATIGDLAGDLDRSSTAAAARSRHPVFLEHPLGKVLNSMRVRAPHRFANPGRLTAYAGIRRPPIRPQPHHPRPAPQRHVRRQPTRPRRPRLLPRKRAQGKEHTPGALFLRGLLRLCGGPPVPGGGPDSA